MLTTRYHGYIIGDKNKAGLDAHCELKWEMSVTIDAAQPYRYFKRIRRDNIECIGEANN